MLENIYIIGTGMTPFGEHFDISLRDLAFDVAKEAVEESGLDITEIDGVVVGNMLGASLSGQGQLGALVASSLGLHVDAFRVEAACASGGVAMKRAIDMLQTGNYENILVVGVEKMTDHPSYQVTEGLAQAADADKEGFFGLTFPSMYAMMAQRYFYEYGVTSKDLAKIAVKNHFHGARNKKAQYQKEVTEEVVLGSTMVASPLRLFDCSPITDGAAAVVISREKRENAVSVIASELAVDSLALEDREDMTSVKAARIASEKAYKSAEVSAEDIDIVEVHDCFTIAELMALEDLGFAEKGKGAELVHSGALRFDGEKPVNTSGGLKACGHPVGATGIKQIIEVTHQLQGRAEGRQVVDARIGLTHNVGGSGATCVVHILKK